jgi:ribosomal protein L23
VNHDMLLFRQTRDYGSKTVNFKVNPFLSKPEIEQYLRKLYKLPIESIHTVNKQGEIKRSD